MLVELKFVRKHRSTLRINADHLNNGRKVPEMEIKIRLDSSESFSIKLSCTQYLYMYMIGKMIIPAYGRYLGLKTDNTGIVADSIYLFKRLSSAINIVAL